MKGEPNDLPRAFGDYVLLRRLAVGGMAEVYVAKSRGIGGFEKLVAIKVIHPRFSEDETFVKLLIEEAKISVLLTHVNIGQIFDLGCVDGTYFIAMEYIEGADAYRVLRKASDVGLQLPVDVCLFIASEMCAGLDYAHRKRDADGRPLGIVHRDISPQNVLLSFSGEVKIVDFGIAKASSRTGQTEAGVIKGKFYYMSPEQAWADPLDARSDIFSTGIVLYELLTGEMLYREESIPLLLDKVRKAEILPPHHKRPDIPHEVSAVVMKALARKPEDRYQTAHEMGQALTQVLYQLSPSFTSARLSDLLLRLFPADARRSSDHLRTDEPSGGQGGGTASGPPASRGAPARPAARARSRGSAPDVSGRPGAAADSAAAGSGRTSGPGGGPRPASGAVARASAPMLAPARFDLADDDDDRTRNELRAYRRSRGAATGAAPATRTEYASRAGVENASAGAVPSASASATTSASAASASSADAARGPGASIAALDFDDEATSVGSTDAYSAALVADGGDPRAGSVSAVASVRGTGDAGNLGADTDFEDEATRVEDKPELPGAPTEFVSDAPAPARPYPATATRGAAGPAPEVAVPATAAARPVAIAQEPVHPVAPSASAPAEPSLRQPAGRGLPPPFPPSSSHAQARRVTSPFDPIASVPPRPPAVVSWPPPPPVNSSALPPTGSPRACAPTVSGTAFPSAGAPTVVSPEGGGAAPAPPSPTAALPGGAFGGSPIHDASIIPVAPRVSAIGDPFVAPPSTTPAAHPANAAPSRELLSRFGWVGLAVAGLVVAASAAWFALRGRVAGHELRVVSVPAGARVAVDGVAVPGTTPLEVSVDPRREHRVEVTLEGYRPFAERTPAGRPPAMVVAVLDGARIALLVRSAPAGALVFIDDEFVGNAPVSVERPPGTYTVRLRLPGHEEARREVRLEVGVPPPPLDVTLVPAGPSAGALRGGN